MEQINKLTIKGVIHTLKNIPKTIGLIYKIESKFFTSLLLLSIVMGVIPIMSLYISQELINSISINSDSNQIFNTLAIYIFVGVFSSLLSKCYSYLDSKFNMCLGYKINTLLLNKISGLNLNDFEKSDTYNKIEKITQESSYKPFQIIKAIITMFTSIIALISSTVYIATWNIYVALILLVVPMATIMIFLKMGQKEFLIAWKRANEERKTWYWIHLLTHDFSFKEIKLNGISEYIINDFSRLKKKFINEDLSLLKKRNIINFLFDMSLQLLNIIVMILIIISIKAGEILIGNFVGIIRAVSMVNENSQEIIEEIYIIYNSSLFMNEFFDFINTSLGSEVRLTKKTTYSNFDSITLDNVSYLYNESDKGVKNISFKLNKGDIVAIVGENGSGKSTLAKLLCGLYKPIEGNIYYGNYINNGFGQEFYEKNISVLFQDYTKFELTLRENIGFGDIDNIDNDNRIIAILDKLNMSFLRNDEVYNLDLQLGSWFENGRQLSGGEWQRVALARTFIKDAGLYILDEPNSALDPTVEKYIFEMFLKLSKDSITIFITHNILAAQNANKIIVMKDGNIVGEGNHDFLYESCDTYKRLYDADIYQR